MRSLGIFVGVCLVAVAALQSIIGGAPEGRATSERLSLAVADICTVEAIDPPVVKREKRNFTVMPAHKTLAVAPAKFGTRIEELVVVPEHREGATFFTEQKRVIVSEPTRRLRVIEPTFDTVFAITDSVERARVSEGILITDTEMLSAGPEAKILLSEARIQAVRINAGLKMQEIKVIDEEGEGDIVPATTIPIEVRTVETHPVVSTTDVAAVDESFDVEIVETPARTVEADAVCTIASRPALIARVQAALAEQGQATGEAGTWSSSTIDAVAAAQTDSIGLVSPFLLLETLKKWVPEVETPTS